MHRFFLQKLEKNNYFFDWTFTDFHKGIQKMAKSDF